jgi:hypothetical protein
MSSSHPSTAYLLLKLTDSYQLTMNSKENRGCQIQKGQIYHIQKLSYDQMGRPFNVKQTGSWRDKIIYFFLLNSLMATLKENILAFFYQRQTLTRL